MMKRLGVILTVFACLCAMAAEVIPKKPENHFNDYASLVSPGKAQELNSQLENFERATSSQLLVAIYPKMQSDSSIDDYTVRVARAWEVGLKGKDNGAVLFVFVQDHKMFIQVGYGLEGAMPDATCKQITEYIIKPYFQRRDYAGGLTAGVNAMMSAAKGEFKGTGRSVADQVRRVGNRLASLVFIIIFIIFFCLAAFARRRSGWVYGGGGWGGGGWGGGGWGGGGGGGGGSFSSGGGSFGGGGAGSSW